MKRRKMIWIVLLSMFFAGCTRQQTGRMEETAQMQDTKGNNEITIFSQNADNDGKDTKEDTDVVEKSAEEQMQERGKEGEMEKVYEYEVKEFKVSCGDQGEIYGKLYAPKEDGSYGAVILSHGYNGSHTDYDFECKELASRGYVAYAYDFRNGSRGSRSGNQTEQMTVFTEKEDLLTVYNAIAELPIVNRERIFLFGGSQGGFVTALAAEELKDQVKAIALYYPAFNIPDDWRKNFREQQDIPETTEFWGMTLGREFFTSIREFDTFENIGGYEEPVLIIYGDQDPIVPMSAMEKAKDTYQNAELLILKGEGHGFSPKAAQNAIEQVIVFFSGRNPLQ